MNKEDKKRFVQIMLGMADNFRDSITKEGMAMRFDMLKEYTIQQVENAAKQIMFTRKYTKMPTIADFIESLNINVLKPEDKALVFANEIITHSRTQGSNIFPSGLDDIAKHLMTRRWPYAEWSATVLTSELIWWIKEFREAYKVYSEMINNSNFLENPHKDIKALIGSIGTKINN